MTAVIPLTAGSLLDFVWGDPRWLPHPIVGFGKVIAWGERRVNGRRFPFIAGLVFSVCLIAGVFVLTREAEIIAFRVHWSIGLVFISLGVFFCLAHRTLLSEGRAVFRALDEDLDSGRRRLRWIVGRDTASLSAQEVRTAVFETMAENLSDGVIAPLFFYGLFGLPGMFAYKMVNTLDSMIGHKDARYFFFGKVAARIDDAANFLPARLTALLLVLAARSRPGWYFILRYGQAHVSPNAGYPEAALAGILDLRFGGPHTYDGELIKNPWIGVNNRVIETSEIERVVGLNHRVAMLGLSGAIFLKWIIFLSAF